MSNWGNEARSLARNTRVKVEKLREQALQLAAEMETADKRRLLALSSPSSGNLRQILKLMDDLGRSLVEKQAAYTKNREVMLYAAAAANSDSSGQEETAKVLLEIARKVQKLEIKIQLPDRKIQSGLSGAGGGWTWLDDMNALMMANSCSITGAIGSAAGSIVPGIGTMGGTAAGKVSCAVVTEAAKISEGLGVTALTAVISQPLALAQAAYQLHKSYGDTADAYMVGAATAGPIGVAAVGAYQAAKSVWSWITGGKKEEEKNEKYVDPTISYYCREFPASCSGNDLKPGISYGEAYGFVLGKQQTEVDAANALTATFQQLQQQQSRIQNQSTAVKKNLVPVALAVAGATLTFGLATILIVKKNRKQEN